MQLYTIEVKQAYRHFTGVIETIGIANYFYVESKDIEAIKKRYENTENDTYFFEITKQTDTLSNQVKNKIIRNDTFIRNNIYGRKELYPCSRCQEKAQAYVIRKVIGDIVKEGTLYASFCHSCEYKYYKNPGGIGEWNAIRTIKNALDQSKVSIRLRGGYRQSVDVLSGTNVQEEPERVMITGTNIERLSYRSFEE